LKADSLAPFVDLGIFFLSALLALEARLVAGWPFKVAAAHTTTGTSIYGHMNGSAKTNTRVSLWDFG